MKALTLKQLRKAMHVLKTTKQFRIALVESLELQAAENVLLGLDVDEMPRDPRTVLTEIGYKW